MDDLTQLAFEKPMDTNSLTECSNILLVKLVLKFKKNNKKESSGKRQWEVRGVSDPASIQAADTQLQVLFLLNHSSGTSGYHETGSMKQVFQ